MLKKILNWYDKILGGICIAMVSSFVCITLIQVICRKVLNDSLSWSEELCRILFVCCGFLASALCVLDKRHVAVDILTQNISRKANRYLSIFINTACFVFCIFIVISGYQAAEAASNLRSTALLLPMGKIYLIMPLSGILMAINFVRAGYQDFFVTYAPESEEVQST